MTAQRSSGLRLLGLGAAACLGCCAGPIFAVLGGIGATGLVSSTVLGGTGLVVAGVAAVAYLIARGRRSRACAVTLAEPVPLATPTRRERGLEPEEVPAP